MKTKKILLLLFALLLGLPSMADDKENALVVWKKDGTKLTYILLNDRPHVTLYRYFGRAELWITAANNSNPSSWQGTLTTLPLADVQRFTYEKVEDPDAVKEVRDNLDEQSPVSYGADGTVLVSNVEAGQPVGIWSLDGQLLRQLTPRVSGEYKVSLSGLAPGVYLLKAGKTTTKITKR